MAQLLQMHRSTARGANRAVSNKVGIICELYQVRVLNIVFNHSVNAVIAQCEADARARESFNNADSQNRNNWTR